MFKKVRAFVVLFVFSMVCTSGCYLWSSSDTYYGLDTEAGEEILFVFDVSGSMTGSDEGVTPQGRLSSRGREEAISRGTSAAPSGCAGGEVSSRAEDRAQEETTALGAAKRELIPVIRGLDPNTEFNIITFGRDITDWKPNMVRATDSNRSEATDYVGDLDARGGTPAMSALERAFDEEPGIIFFLSDGVPTDSEPQAILDQVDEWNADGSVTIHAIGLGDHLDDVFMDRLASQNGGEFVHR